MHTDIAQQRLLSQRIAGTPFQHPEEVVRWMGAQQAQDYQQALWAIALRTQGATLADVEQAIADRKIVRTWPMRGTLHFLPAEDAQWMLKLSAARMLAGTKRRREQLELDEATLERTQELFSEMLSGGRCLSRPAMMQLLEDAGIRTAGQRGYHLLYHMAQTGLICLGPHEGKQQTFTLLDEWVPTSRQLSREAALAELARRYFTSHGPATLHDFAWWAGLTIADARAGLEVIRSQLLAEKLDGQHYWMGRDVLEHQVQRTPRIFLLPGFDEYLLGYKVRDAVLVAEHAQKIVPGNNGVFKPMLVVSGQIVGTWKRIVKRNALDLLLTPFIPLGDAQEEAIEAARCYSDFLQLPLASTAIAEYEHALESED